MSRRLSLWDALVDHWRYFTFQNRIGYRFKKVKLLDQSLSHPSYSPLNNQRLEFLGDAVLELLVAEHLYRELPDINEGTLTSLKIMSVNNMHLKGVALKLQIHKYLQVGSGLKLQPERHDKLQADAVEALIGAIFIDGGLKPARRFVNRFVLQSLPRYEESDLHPKTALQNWLSKQGHDYPEYEVLSSPENGGDNVWSVKCSVKHMALTRTAKGNSRKEAETKAATLILNNLTAINDAGSDSFAR